MNYKEIEQIRKDANISQDEFAKMIGASRRTYNYRITNEQPWILNEVIIASTLNKGKVKVKVGDSFYDITIKKVEL